MHQIRAPLSEAYCTCQQCSCEAPQPNARLIHFYASGCQSIIVLACSHCFQMCCNKLLPHFPSSSRLWGMQVLQYDKGQIACPLAIGSACVPAGLQ